MEVTKSQEGAREPRPEKSGSPVDLHGFFQERERVFEELDRALEEKAGQLRALMPDRLKAFKEEGFLVTPKWLKHLYRNTQDGGCNSLSIGNYEVYGFRDQADAADSMNSLKEVWKGIIDVDVNVGGQHVLVEFRLAEE